MADNALQVASPQTAIQPQTFAPRTLAEAVEFAKLISDSGMVPKDYIGKPGAIVVALQMGMEVGLQPMQALQSIAVINGRPSIWGDGALAIVKTHPDFVSIQEDDAETIRKNGKATCIIKRRGQPDVIRTFSTEDAKTANLWGKAGPWTTNPPRMMQMRARGFAMRDQFPDALKGTPTAEEVQDYQTIEGEKTTPAQAMATAQVQQSTPVQDTIGTEKATLFYKLYRGQGWTPAEAQTFLKETFGIEAPRNSKDIPVSGWGKAEAWAKTKAPVREEADKLFTDLGFTMDEQAAFCNEQKWNFAAIVDELKKRLEEKNKAEQ